MQTIQQLMGKHKTILLPSQERTLQEVGGNIQLARLRRNLSTEQISERAGIARSTLVKVEKGDQGVAIGAYLKVLFVLGLDYQLKQIGAEDTLGRKLQDAKLIK